MNEIFEAVFPVALFLGCVSGETGVALKSPKSPAVLFFCFPSCFCCGSAGGDCGGGGEESSTGSVTLLVSRPPGSSIRSLMSG